MVQVVVSWKDANGKLRYQFRDRAIYVWKWSHPSCDDGPDCVLTWLAPEIFVLESSELQMVRDWHGGEEPRVIESVEQLTPPQAIEWVVERHLEWPDALRALAEQYGDSEGGAVHQPQAPAPAQAAPAASPAEKTNGRPRVRPRRKDQRKPEEVNAAVHGYFRVTHAQELADFGKRREQVGPGDRELTTDIRKVFGRNQVALALGIPKSTVGKSVWRDYARQLGIVDAAGEP